MKITYVYHSCFVVELEQSVIIFDYYKGTLPELDQKKPVYVFSSHAHYDHYNKNIFSLLKDYEVTYILSDDIRDIPAGKSDQVTTVGPGESRQVKQLEIQTLKSTDEGVAFIISDGTYRLYYAGDLNWWHWEGEPDPWNPDMKRAYQKEIDKLKGESFDVAFIPVDGRLEAAYSYGLTYFMEQADAAHIVPMHQWGAYELTEKLKREAAVQGYAERIHEIHGEGEFWTI